MESNWDKIIDQIENMDIGDIMKIDLGLGSKEDWNSVLDYIGNLTNLEGIWYSSEVNDDDEIECFPPIQDSDEDEGESDTD